MKLEVDKRFAKKVQARYGNHELEAGILQNRPHMRPKSKKAGLGTLQGGPVRKQTKTSYQSVSEVSEELRKRRVNFYKKPFEKKRSKDLDFFKRIFAQFVQKQKTKAAVESAFRAIIRNPFLQKKYGRNAETTAQTKGFNRYGIDTGQLFRNIKAKLRRKK